ncbi:MAG: DoxX family protein [Chitinophagales bacterium]
MNTSQQLDAISEKNQTAFILGLRVLLGVILVIKGYMFMFRLNELSDVVQALGMGAFNVTLAMIVAIAQLLCGLLIMAGLMTRLSCLVLFPILIGAVFYVNLRQGFITSSEWMLSVMILYLLIFFFVNGAGEFSVYHLISKSIPEKQMA